MARYLLLVGSFLVLGVAAMAQTSLQGKVTDENGEPLLFANVVLKKNGNFVTGTETDLDGNYSIGNIDPGTYEVEVSYLGYPTQRITGVVVYNGKANRLDITMSSEGGIVLEEVVVKEYKVPLIEQDNTSTGGTLTSEQIEKLPTRNVNALAATTAGIASSDEGGALNVKGSRSNATNYYLDGVRVFGRMVPQTEIDQLQVITGGIEAQYGDVTGGIISITTKGPSSRFTGGVEVETSEFLDPYGYNLINGNVSGPLLKNKNGESVLGFRLAGQLLKQRDDDPPAIPVYRVKDEVLQEMEANPITILGGGAAPIGEQYTNEHVNALDYKPYEDRQTVDLTFKLDARLSKAIDLTLTGTYSDIQNQFTPGGWRVFNSHNNPTSYSTRYRTNVRLRHRLGMGNTLPDDATDEEKAARAGGVIQNASYTLQFGYERSNFLVYDPHHEDRLFDYGYIGRFDYEWEPTFDFSDFPPTHNDYRQVFTGYTPGDKNPVLVNYNNVVDDANDINQYIAVNGFMSNLYTSIFGLHTNVGQVYNRYQKSQSDIYTFNAKTSFELVPGSSDKGRHYIQLGVTYEQRTRRGYSISPRSLWVIAQQSANRHILGVDTTNVLYVDTLFGTPVPIYGTQIEAPEDLYFYQRVRELTGQSLHEFVNVDALDPADLRLDMFSPKELNDQYGLVGLDYYGYDYLGNLLDGVTFDDFFTATDANGVRTFPVAPNRPIYTAAYIQDKFTFKDVIFRVGLRVDRYDANTKVLKDPYSLYDIMTAADFHAKFGGERPGNIGDDYKVYVTEDNGTVVKAYRHGDTWYRPNGTQVNDGTEIFGGELVFPKYTVENPNIQARDYDPSISFQDYEPQVNFMPRLAFSFPISDEANFFAHYDILVQRPPSNTIATALDYFYFATRTGIKNNPALKPERTVDYEVGFQQKLTNTSALKIAAYYKEMRDMIQARYFLFLPAPINQYETYDNLDFGTVKGFTFQYDLRRTGNVSLNVAYTLQFADGTGSDANTSRGLSSRGIQRTLFPLSFDERHRINVILDYRYGSGRRYNGPRVNGVDIFANAGINLQTVAVSGRPYTRKTTPAPFGGQGTEGSINGARLPWNFTINMRIDKDFNLTKPDAARPLGLNVYFRVSNLLDRRNIIAVYPATGSPSDDGYLATGRGARQLEEVGASGRSIEAYLASYQWAMLNPNFYSLPRRMYVGAILQF